MNEAQCKALLDMNWGSFTPEFSSEQEIVHVLNHDLSDIRSVHRTVLFIIGRIRWFKLYFKKDVSHIVIVDDVGQQVTPETREYIRQAVLGIVDDLRFMSQEA